MAVLWQYFSGYRAMGFCIREIFAALRFERSTFRGHVPQVTGECREPVTIQSLTNNPRFTSSFLPR